MQNITIKLLAVFIVSGILKIVVHMLFNGSFIGIGGGILIDVAVLGYIYLLLKEYHYPNLKKIMLFLGGIIFISILIDLSILGGDLGNLLILSIIAWMIFGKDGFFSGRRFR